MLKLFQRMTLSQPVQPPPILFSSRECSLSSASGCDSEKKIRSPELTHFTRKGKLLVPGFCQLTTNQEEDGLHSTKVSCLCRASNLQSSQLAFYKTLLQLIKVINIYYGKFRKKEEFSKLLKFKHFNVFLSLLLFQANGLFLFLF